MNGTDSISAGLLCLAALLAAGCGSDAGGEQARAPRDTVEAPGTVQSGAWFVEEARERGIDFTWRSGHGGKHYFPEIMGGGAALADLDRDGDLDAYLVQGGSVLATRAEQPPNALFENRGAGRFVDVTEASGSGDRGFGMGAAVGDVDGDGLGDLYVTNVRANTLLANRGGLSFRDATARAGVGEGTWSASSAFFDPDRDGDLDLFVVNYVLWRAADELTCYSKPHPEDYCSPKSYDAPAPDSFFENRGDGTFRDVSAQIGVRTAFGNGLGIVTFDFDRDGWEDAFVANDGMPNQLWKNLAGERFRDVAVELGCAVDQDGRAKAGMGTAAADLDDDGDEDLLVVNLTGETDSYFRNDGRVFSDRTPLVGLAGRSRPYTRFGMGLVDFDHDGRLDLYQANGRVTRDPDGVVGGTAGGARQDPFAQANLLFRGLPGPRFEEVLPRGGTDPVLYATSRAAAFGDVDGDGAVDVLVVNRDAPAHLLMNRAAEGHWLLLRVLERSGRPALGATVTLSLEGRRLLRRVQSAYSYCAANAPEVHVGLGEAERVGDVRVRWVDGVEESFGDLAADQLVELRRGDGS